ncbi:MAG: GreA/GreB family elongation factor [Cyclobacteriaceae bacterium]|nr:GreA/GreB family elongation factor [Cyclobacteriaceae bacterium SS2]
MIKRKLITSDYAQLVSRREGAILHAEFPHLLEEFYQELLNAELVDAEQINVNLIKLNCRIRLKEKNLGKFLTVTLALPEDANPNEFKVSVFSSIGMSLIGRSVGDQVSWKIHNLTAYFEVIEVTHQSEIIEHLKPQFA